MQGEKEDRLMKRIMEQILQRHEKLKKTMEKMKERKTASARKKLNDNRLL
jgi:hypothetical protein